MTDQPSTKETLQQALQKLYELGDIPPRRHLGIQLSRDVDSTRSIQAQETALRAAEPEDS